MDLGCKKMTVHEVAALTGITNRTLHYYDEIGLLTPSAVTAAKYRIYTDDDLIRLQEILFFKEMGFSLKEIKGLINASIDNRQEALRNHLKILGLKKKRIERLLDLASTALEGGGICSFEAFSNQEILEAQAQFQKEARKNWGTSIEYQSFDHFFSEHTQRERMSKWNGLMAQSQSLFKRIAEYTSLSPALPEVQELVKEWQDYISENFYPCSNEMLSYLGQLYVTDHRFSDYIDRFGNGVSAFFRKAIQHYCTSLSSMR